MMPSTDGGDGATLESTKVRVHNADLYVEYMQSADWSENRQKGQPTTPGSARRHGNNASAGVKRQPKKFGGSFGAPPGTNKGRTPGALGGTSGAGGSSVQQQQEKQREAFLEKQVVREQQFRQKFEVAKQQAERRAKERTDQKEKDFEERFLDFVTQNQTLVNEVDGAVRADEAWRTRKRERLFNEWTLNVFQPMQEEINSKIASQYPQELEQRRCQMFQSFLDESNRKKNGLFRDIIIESDYDPVSQAKGNTMSYSKAKVNLDPTKNRSTREEGDSLVRGLMSEFKKDGANGGNGGSGQGKDKSRMAVSVEMWDRMESTPYGRYSNEKERKTKSEFLKSNVGFDHYTYKTGRAALEGEQVIRGKGNGPASNPAKQSNIQECFTLPTKKPMSSAPGGITKQGSFLPNLANNPIINNQ